MVLRLSTLYCRAKDNFDSFILLYIGTKNPIMKLPNMLLGFAAIAAMAVNSQMGTTIKVAVGEGESLRYSPNNITAKVGTAIEFNFFPNVIHQVESLPTKLKNIRRIILLFSPPLPIPAILS
jgi:hypothetical protein